MRPYDRNNIKHLFVSGLALTAILAFVSPVQAGCSDDPAHGVDWRDCRKHNLILSKASLERSDLSGADLSFTNLGGANLGFANLTKANLTRSRLDSVSAPHSIFIKAFGSRTNFSGANLEKADFERAEFSRSDFTNANLANADFNRSELGRSDFSGAKLMSPDFSFANLARADFRNASFSGSVNVKGAYLLKTRLEGIDLTNFTGLAQWQVNMLCGNDDTKLGKGLTRPDDWTCVDDE